MELVRAQATSAPQAPLTPLPGTIARPPAALQSGVNAEAISHEDYLNAPGESFSVTFDTAGSYGYYCEPHQGAGMAGESALQRWC